MADLDAPCRRQRPARAHQRTHAVRPARRVRRQESTYKSAGSVHGCALFRRDELLMFVGTSAATTPSTPSPAGCGCTAWTAPTDLLHDRAADQRDGHQVGADGRAIVVSRSGITQMGYELARQLGLALFGRATNRHFLCYTDSSASTRAELARPSASRRCGPGRAAPSGRAALDLGERLRPSRRERAFGHHEHQADQQAAGDVVDEGRLAALVPVADELDQPAEREREARCPSQPDARAAVAQRCASATSTPTTAVTATPSCWVAARQVPKAAAANTSQAGESAQPPTRNRGLASNAEAKTIIGTPTKMARDVAPVAVVRRVLDEEVGGAAHGKVSGRDGCCQPNCRHSLAAACARRSLKCTLRTWNSQMSIKSDKWIRRMAEQHGMIEPFEPGQVRYARTATRSSATAPAATATTSAARRSSRSSPTSTRRWSIRRTSTKSFVDIEADVCIIPPNSFALARTVEYFRIPRNVLTICLGKSTYALRHHRQRHALRARSGKAT